MDVNRAKLHHHDGQVGFGPDYSNRRRIRDVEANLDPAQDTRFVETHTAAESATEDTSRVRQKSRTLATPGGEEGIDAVKAKLLMQATSLGIADGAEFSQKVVQEVVDRAQVCSK